MEWMRRAVGGNLEQVVSRLLPEDARSEANVNRVKATTARFTPRRKNPDAAVSRYAGAGEGLRARGVHLTINSNKLRA
jgi:hypothetical protein